jgi:DNA modification methylase
MLRRTYKNGATDVTAKPKPKVKRKPKLALTNDPRNANRHTPQSLDAVKRSFAAMGAGRSVLADNTGTLIAGEASLKAAQDLGIRVREIHTTGDELLVVVRDDLAPDDQKRRALALADNQVGKLSEFDEDGLVDELKAIGDRDLLDAIGFTSEELEDLLTPEGADGAADTGDNGTPTDQPTVTQPGDLWILGRHRLLCADSTKAEDVDKLMEQYRAQLVFTDPPYGVTFSGVMASERGDWEHVQGDQKRDDDLIQNLLLPAFRQAVRVSRDDAAFYIWHPPGTDRHSFEFAMNAAGLVEKQTIIWVKPTFVLGHSDYHNAYEPCTYLAKSGQKPRWIGDRCEQTVWRITRGTTGGVVDIANGLRITDGAGAEVCIQRGAPKAKKLRVMRLTTGQSLTLTTSGGGDAWEVACDPKSECVHPTQKPAELAMRAIKNHCSDGNIVLDLFGGSGSTMAACQATATRAFLMEMEPRYADAICRRFQKLTGQQAMRDGEPFPIDEPTDDAA